MARTVGDLLIEWERRYRKTVGSPEKQHQVLEALHATATDRTDPRTNATYFVAAVRPDMDEIARLPGVRLYPGMPASVTIPTENRTALDYLLGPLLMSFNNAFRQK